MDRTTQAALAAAGALGRLGLIEPSNDILSFRDPGSVRRAGMS